jgi:hypothetical protein
MTTIAVCYAFARPAGMAPLALPPGVLSLELANFGTKAKPVLDSVSAQTANPNGRILNFEPDNLAPVPLAPWRDILKEHWPSTGRVYAYGIDAGVRPSPTGQVWDNPMHRLSMALRRPLPPAEKLQYAALAYDGYVHPGYDNPKKYHNWTRHRRERLEDATNRNGVRSGWCIEVQRQIGIKDAYDGGLILHTPVAIDMQIKAAGTSDIIIFAGAKSKEIAERVDDAVLRTIERVKAMRGIP